MEVKNPIRKRLNKGFSLITIVCCIALVLCDIAMDFHRVTLVRLWLHSRKQEVP